MKSLLLPVGLAVLFLCPLTDVWSGGVIATSTPDAKSPADASAADLRVIAEARAAGQRGLDALMSANEDLIERMRSGATPLSDPSAAKLRTTLDAAAKQRDAHASGLYWYTDLEAAKAEARASGKRILSLRLLGNLDEEFSCANSRFFRTALYANKEVSHYLRENFVLHWKSVRPAPKLTIDMGDGRRLERTITGNSIHYVLAPDGFVLDAIPGLYGPREFMDALRFTDAAHRDGVIPGLEDPSAPPSHKMEALQTALKGAAVTDEIATVLAKKHGETADATCRGWLMDAIEAGTFGQDALREDRTSRGVSLFYRLLPTAFPSRKSLLADIPPAPAQPAANKSRKPSTSQKTVTQQASAPQKSASSKRKPSAQEAEMQTVGKRMVESPIVQRSIPEPQLVETSQKDPAPGMPLSQRMTPGLWKNVSIVHARRYGAAKLDEASRRFMMAKLPDDAVRKDERTAGGVIDENTPFARTLRNFEAAMAEDTIRNEFLFHSQIHQWLEQPVTGLALARDVEALNKKVYAELFLTPDHDAWLGLVPENVYTALEKDGCACDAMRGKK